MASRVRARAARFFANVWNRKRILSVAANLLLLLTAVFAALVLAEIVVRAAAPQQLIIKRPDVWRPVDRLGWQHQPSIATTINTGERTVSLHTDERGFRVGAEGRSQADVEVLLLGDSFMEALQVDYEQSTAGLLERRLSTRLGRSVGVWNTGVEDWNPNHYLMQAEDLLGERSFDLVLVSLYVGNDAVVGRAEYAPRAPTEVRRLRLPRAVSRGEVVDALLYPVNDFLETRSHLFVFMRTRLRNLLMRVGLSPVGPPVGVTLAESGWMAWDFTAGLAADIAAAGAARNAPVVFFLVPSAHQVDPSLFDAFVSAFGLDRSQLDPDQPSKRLLESLQREGLAVVDPLGFMKQRHLGGEQLFGTIDTHLSPSGHIALVDFLEPTLLSLLPSVDSLRATANTGAN